MKSCGVRFTGYMRCSWLSSQAVGARQGAARWAAGDGSGLPEEARGWLQQVLRRGRGLGAVEGVRAFGQGGRALEVLQSGLHVALKADDYAGGVRQNILAGGDSTARWGAACWRPGFHAS